MLTYADSPTIKTGRKVRIEEFGKVYGRLTVGEFAGRNGRGQAFWWCDCVCGNVSRVQGCRLRTGKTKSCGCYRRDDAGLRLGPANYKEDANIRNGWYRLSYGLRFRSQKKGIAYEFKNHKECAEYLESIAPTHCPVFGFEMGFGKGIRNPEAFSVDRVDPSGGYTRDNTRIISFLANAMKFTATREQLILFANWVQANAHI